MPIAEPTLAALPNPAARYFLATRPPFLAVTLAGCAIGLATARHGGATFSAITALATVIFALAAHAGANVLNDYYDSRNGTDAANTERIFPFTGGSRIIQNGVLTESQMLVWGSVLLGATAAAGLVLMAVSGPGLFWIGLAGLFVGWAYSGTPLRLNSRGLGEPCIALAWMLVPAGADFVQRGTFSAAPWAASAGYALLVTNILYINQFPDLRADAAAGKRHWVVRLGAQPARWGYVAIGLAAYGSTLWAVAAGTLPRLALASLVAAALTLRAARVLFAHATEPARLAPALVATIGAALLHGTLLAAALLFTKPA